MNDSRWQVSDLLNLDCFLHKDRSEREYEDSHLALRDRLIYRDIVSSEPADVAEPEDRTLVRRWLEKRCRQYVKDNPREALPGKVWKEISSLALWCSLGLGILAGVAICFPYFSYTGTAPLNVTVYFAVFVVAQVFLALLQAVALSVNGIRGKGPPKSILAGVTLRLVMRLVGGISKRFFRDTGSHAVEQLVTAMRRLQHRKGYIPLSLWSAFVLVQFVGIGFNVGIVATTLVKVSVADIAFGWQSTLQVQEQLLARAVQWVALPWSWILPEHLAFPDLEAITGSRIILKDGIRHLATANLVTWWPFLCLSVVCYGLMPRFFLLAFGLHRRRRELRKLPVMDMDVVSLLRRMKTAALEIGTQRETDEKIVDKPAASSHEMEEPSPDEVESEPEEPMSVILVPDELEGMFEHEELTARFFGETEKESILCTFLFFGELEGADLEMTQSIKRIAASGREVKVYMLQEGWQPPIEESLELLRSIRSAAGEAAAITMFLAGKPRPETIFTPASEEQLTIWKNKVELLHDPNLEIKSC